MSVKWILLLGVLCFSIRGWAENYTAKKNYTVIFEMEATSCMSDQMFQKYQVIYFGKQDRDGDCVDDPRLACTSAMDFAHGEFLLKKYGVFDFSSRRSVCTVSAFDWCSEALFLFSYNDQIHQDELKIDKFIYRKEDLMFSRQTIFPIKDVLGRQRSYFLTSSDGCDLWSIRYKIVER